MIAPEKKRYFRLGSRVVAYSILTNEKIIGIYKSSRTQFGVVIHGRPLHTSLPDLDYICSRLTMQLYTPPPPKGSLHKDHKPKAGDKVQGTNKMGLTVIGFYMNKDRDYAWVKGHVEKESMFETPRAHKVIYSTLRILHKHVQA